MNKKFFKIKSEVIHWLYTKILKPLFFRFDPEFVHDRMTDNGRLLGRFAIGRALTRALFHYHHHILKQTVAGIEFDNPIGLAAGFDKDAQLVNIMPHVGFGFEEIGSVSAKPCEGNPKPRLWRLSKSKSLVVYYGLKSEGCAKVSARLRDVLRSMLRNNGRQFPVGTSIAMTNCPENCDTQLAITDYATAARAFNGIGAYTTVNISCPNALADQPFNDPDKLDQLLTAIDSAETVKPIFLKVSPDLTDVQKDGLVEVIKRHRVTGLILTNLTKPRENVHIKDQSVPDHGGMSGKVVEELSNNLLKYFYQKLGKQYILIGCGGVFTAEDAYKKIRLGASLVQLITGMIYEGPQRIGQINQGLVELLKRDGYKNIGEAIGADYR